MLSDQFFLRSSTIVTIDPVRLNASTERTEVLLEPVATAAMVFDTASTQLIAVSIPVGSNAVVHFINVSNNGWEIRNKTVQLATAGARISAAAVDPRGLLYVASAGDEPTQTQAAIFQVDIPNANMEVATPISIAQALTIDALTFSEHTDGIYLASLAATANLVVGKWTAAVPCESNCNGNGFCTTSRTCVCNDPSKFSQPWCSTIAETPVSPPVADAPPQAISPTEAAPIALTPTAGPVANTSTPVSNSTTPSTDSNTAPTGPSTLPLDFSSRPRCR